MTSPPFAALVPCPNHPEVTEGLGACGVCRRNFCSDCLVTLGGVPTCADCKLERLDALRSGQAEGDLAGPWRRFAAQFVDGLVFFIPSVVLYSSGLFFSPWSALVAPGLRPANSPPTLLWLPVLLTFLLMAAVVVYEALMLTTYGQTLGKMALGIKVVTPSGGDIRPGQAWVRAVSRSVMSFLYCVGLLDVLFIFSARHRTLHDRLAQTVVMNWKR